MMMSRIVVFLIFLIVPSCEKEEEILYVTVSEFNSAQGRVVLDTNGSFQEIVNLEEVPKQIANFLKSSSFDDSQIDLETTEKWISAKLQKRDFEPYGIKVRLDKRVSGKISSTEGEMVDPFE